jgi:hypothetical protein
LKTWEADDGKGAAELLYDARSEPDSSRPITEGRKCGVPFTEP